MSSIPNTLFGAIDAATFEMIGAVSWGPTGDHGIVIALGIERYLIVTSTADADQYNVYISEPPDPIKAEADRPQVVQRLVTLDRLDATIVQLAGRVQVAEPLRRPGLDAMQYITRAEYEALHRQGRAGPRSTLLPETQQKWTAPCWRIQLVSDGGTDLVPTTVCDVITVTRTDLRENDLWWYHGGWNRVITNANNQPGNLDDQRRTLTRIHAIIANDSAMTDTTRTWRTGLRSDLAELDMCKVWRPID